MSNLSVICGRVSADKIQINKNELAQRLKTDRSFEHSTVDLCIEEFNKIADYRYAYVCVPVSFAGENICDLGFGNIQSKNLYDVLKDCKKAIIFAVTTGIGVDRLLNRLSVTSSSKHFITDAVASAGIETFCDYVDGILRKNPDKPHRFSIGYGDLPLEIQPNILDILDAYKNLGITINNTLLMTPVKSITAVMGVKDEQNT